MPIFRRAATALSLFLVSAPIAVAQECGGDFGAFLQGVRAEALAEGIAPQAVDRALREMRLDQRVLARDRAQGVFSQAWRDFAGRMVSANRMQLGKKNLQRHAETLTRVEAETGVPGAVIASFWGLETDFGAVLGDFDTLAALATLAHDCRRPELFRPHLIAAIRLVERGDLAPSEMKGAWAGELGQTQLLPEEYIRFGTDADGNGRVDLRKDTADVLATTGKYIQSLGWRGGEPWLVAVDVPADFPLERAGLTLKEPAEAFAALGVTRADGSPVPGGSVLVSLVLPMGGGGPAFLAYPNFDIYLAWNKSLVYSLTAGYFATRLAGAPPIDMGNPRPGLSQQETEQLQRRLVEMGYDVGGVDGILGENTRKAVRAEQQRLGLPADGWPTADLLAAI